MKTIGLDTSVVLRLLVGEPVEQAAAARQFIERCARKGNRPVVSDLVVAEAYHGLVHHYDVPPAEAASALLAMLSSALVTSTGVATSALGSVSGREPGFIDRLIRAEYLRDADDVVTFDRKFSTLPKIKRLKDAAATP